MINVEIALQAGGDFRYILLEFPVGFGQRLLGPPVNMASGERPGERETDQEDESCVSQIGPR